MFEKWGRMRQRIQDASENPMCKEKNLVLNVRVGESGERSVHAEKASLQAERFSHTECLGSQGGEENLQIMMMRSSTRKALEVSVERK